VPGAIVHGFHDYAAYLARVNCADLFLSPFPFGNTNGIVDALTMGLPGVCKRGPEVFERIDGALFERVGMPAWAVAKSVDEYVTAAVRMIDGHAERVDLRQRLIDMRAVERCFEGRPEVFAQTVLELVKRARA
jgi:predicted O-linked N-acetylglucosamine transferase (SPINDLY family)